MSSARPDARRNRRISAIVLLGVLTGVSACSSSSPLTADHSAAIESLRTDPDHRGVVAAYTGGSCDGPASLAVQETASRVDLKVEIGPDPQGGLVCDAAGHERVVSARLRMPVGARTIWADGRRQVPFDGARLLVPSTLPSGFVQVGGGGDSSYAPGGTGPLRSSAWTTRYSQELPVRHGRCTPSRGQLAVTVGPAGDALPDQNGTGAGTARIGGHEARLYRQSGKSAPTARSYVWLIKAGSVQVTNQTSCDGDQLLSPSGLLAFARSLRPA